MVSMWTGWGDRNSATAPFQKRLNIGETIRLRSSKEKREA
jgi:hypothetical protein